VARARKLACDAATDAPGSDDPDLHPLLLTLVSRAVPNRAVRRQAI
jgi:hypothetical protein